MSRGQADGFGLEILSKLKDVKSKDSQTTLLHFLIRTYMKDLDGNTILTSSLPIPEPEDIRRAATVNFDDVAASLHQLKKHLDGQYSPKYLRMRIENFVLGCEVRTKKVIASSTTEYLQPFKEKMETFLEDATKQLNGQNKNLEECKIKFIRTMKYYQFRPKSGTLETFPPNDFFELWLQFCKDFKDIWKKELIRLEKQK